MNNSNTNFNYYSKSDRNNNKNIHNRKKLNRLKVFGFLAFAALLTIIYVNNVIMVNSMLRDVRVLEKELENVEITNTYLMTKLNYLQSPDRIMRIASEKLEMIQNDNIPIVIEK